MFVTPEYVFKDVTHITPEWLAAKGIRALVLDIDNTLTADRSQDLPDEVAGWLAQMKAAGVGLTIVSNGAEKRVRPFARKLGLAYLYRSAKPLPFALMVARRRVDKFASSDTSDLVYGRNSVLGRTWARRSSSSASGRKSTGRPTMTGEGRPCERLEDPVWHGRHQRQLCRKGLQKQPGHPGLHGGDGAGRL